MVEPRQALGRAVRVSVGALVVGGLVYAVWSNRSGATALDWDESWLAFSGAAMLFAVAPLAQSVTLVLALRGFGARASWLATMTVWTRSFLFRYAPSGVVGYVYRLRRNAQLGAEPSAVLKATALEQLGALLAGGVAALAGFAVAGGLGTVALVRGRRVAQLVAVNAAAWFPTGVAVWLLVSDLADEEAPSSSWLLGAYACAWLIGFVVPFAPGGLGLREAALAAFLAAPLGAAAAVTVAVVVRLASTIGELIAIGAVEAAWRLRGPR